LPAGPTEAVARVRVRRGQQFFRQSVLTAYGVRCCISGVNVPRLLTADARRAMRRHRASASPCHRVSGSPGPARRPRASALGSWARVASCELGRRHGGTKARRHQGAAEAGDSAVRAFRPWVPCRSIGRAPVPPCLRAFVPCPAAAPRQSAFRNQQSAHSAFGIRHLAIASRQSAVAHALTPRPPADTGRSRGRCR
jgi:hypothetical protein